MKIRAPKDFWAGLMFIAFGVVITTVALIGVGALGGTDFRWKEVGILSAALAVFAVWVFVKGLGLPIPVWPGE